MTENRQERERGRQTGRIVGRDVPDESKERHTEIAVEAGRSGRGRSEVKSQPNVAHQTDTGRNERERGRQTARIVGRDVPDESKERHTEVAVEAGRKGAEHRNDKR